MDNQLNVLIIGAGNITTNFDDPSYEKILTHSHAITESPHFNLVGFIDIDNKKAIDAVNKWGGRVFSSIDEAINNSKIDIIVIAVSDESHYEILKDISKYPSISIIAEKPLTKTIEQAIDLVRIYKNKKDKIWVNYSRRYLPQFNILKKEITDGLYGEFLTGIGYYGKGLIHNGSHMIDLLTYFLGNFEGFEVNSYEYDWKEDDPSVSATLKYHNNKKFYLQHVNHAYFTIFEIDLLFKKKRIRITDAGLNIEKYEVVENKDYIGYKNLSNSTKITTDIGRNMCYLYENIYLHYTKGEKIKCNIDDAYNSLEKCITIRNSIHLIK